MEPGLNLFFAFFKQFNFYGELLYQAGPQVVNT